jgi:hypothetical protein
MGKDELVKLYVEKMQECVDENYDREMAHVNADNLLVELLDKLGYGEVTSLFEQVKKWYA